MSRATLSERFAALRARDEGALVLFVTAGDQPLSDLPDLLRTLEDAGADVIEVGIPFSDPFGEGPVIQAASQRSLDRGTTPGAVLEAISRADVSAPVVPMGYYNPVLRAGLREFARAARAAGASGTILSDLSPNEADDWIAASRAEGLDTIFLVAPTSSPQRITEVAERSSGFVYVVSRTGVTGNENAMPGDVVALIERVKGRTQTPACVGFGVSRPEHVRTVMARADGAVIGSSLVQLLHETWPSDRRVAEEYVRSLKAATLRA